MNPSTETSHASSPSTDELYVGYLPNPPGYRRFLRLLLPPLAVGFVAVGVIGALSFRSPGDGQWDAQHPREFTGRIDAEPYAMLHVPDVETHGGVRTLLLVREGKHGASELAAPLDGQVARLRGTILERDGRQLLEIIEPILPAASAEVAAAGAPHVASEPLGRVTVRGEIIDPKCFFGAMKPGEGKTHKECATLCIAGGIPPMFLVRAPDGSRTYYLLADQDERSITPVVLPFIADPVEITGVVARRGDLLVLRVDPGGIRRL